MKHYIKLFFKYFFMFIYIFLLIFWIAATNFVGEWLTGIFGEPLAVVIYVVVLCAGFAGLAVGIKYTIEN